MGFYVFLRRPPPVPAVPARSSRILVVFKRTFGIFHRRMFVAFCWALLLGEVMDKNAFSMLARRSAAGDPSSLADLKSSCPPEVSEYLGNPLNSTARLLSESFS